MSDYQHKPGRTDGSATNILYNGVPIQIFDNTNIKPDEEYFFIEGVLAGKSFGFLLEKMQKQKQSDCYTPDGGTQVDDRPKINKFEHLNLGVINELIDSKFNESISEESKSTYSEMILSYESLLEEYLSKYIIIIKCRTDDLPAICYLVDSTDITFISLKTKEWDTFGFDNYYYDTNLKSHIIEPNSIKNIKRYKLPNGNWKP